MRPFHSGGDNIITWKTVHSQNHFSIIFYPYKVLLVAIPLWWAGIFTFCFIFYRFADPPFKILAIFLGIITALIQALIVGYRLNTEKQRGDYLHIDLDKKTIELPRSFTTATWEQQPPRFYVHQFKNYDDSFYEFNIELEDGRCFPILHSIGSTFNSLSSKLSHLGFTVEKRGFKLNSN